MKVYIIDNYDSFTYNLYQFVGEILSKERSKGTVENFELIVKRNDEVSLEDITAAKPDCIIISPGPGSPDDEQYFGICAQVINTLGKTIPLLGVCLGMQGIAHVFGGKVIKAALPMHGKISPINHNNEGIFADIPDQVEVMRYHSLIAEQKSLPTCLTITATVGEVNEKGEQEIMGVKHKDYPIYGIQFHPESFATECGKEMIKNFLFLNAWIKAKK